MGLHFSMTWVKIQLQDTLKLNCSRRIQNCLRNDGLRGEGGTKKWHFKVAKSGTICSNCVQGRWVMPNKTMSLFCDLVPFGKAWDLSLSPSNAHLSIHMLYTQYNCRIINHAKFTNSPYYPTARLSYSPHTIQPNLHHHRFLVKMDTI